MGPSWRRAWQPTPVFLPGEFHGQRSLVDYSLWGHKESDMTEPLTHTHIHTHTHTHTHPHTAERRWGQGQRASWGLQGEQAASPQGSRDLRIPFSVSWTLRRLRSFAEPEPPLRAGRRGEKDPLSFHPLRSASAKLSTHIRRRRYIFEGP